MKYLILSISLLFSLFLLSFYGENPYFSISKKDVALKIPKTFPEPYYRFKDNKLTPERFVLGRKLFFDPILSRDTSTSCASCHQRIAAFGHIDHTLSHGIYNKIGNRNVPALQNLIWKDAFMWDGGINHLEVQALAPLTNPIEMDETVVHVLQKLRADSTYRAMFQKAYKDTLINSERMLKALAQFTGLLISANAKYDRCVAGKDTFSAAEKNGLRLFRAKCESCHKEPLFTDNAYHNNGLKPDTSLHDLGRGKITQNPADNHLYKTPSLRNLEMTYPYMHDGRFRRLKDVLSHYSHAENYYQHSDTALRKIGILSDKERKDIISFLLTLTDRDFLYDKRFNDPNRVMSQP